MGSAGGDRNPRWTVHDGVKVIPSTPEALMAEIDAAVTHLEYSRATAMLNSWIHSRNTGAPPEYDAHAADKAYMAGCTAMTAGNLDEALQLLNLALSKCPPEKTSAIAKLQSLISLVSKQLEEPSKKNSSN